MPDYGFIAQPVQQNAFQKIGEAVNSARGMTDLQRARATLEADIERAKAESARTQTEARVAAQTADPRIAQAQEAEKQARIRSNLEQFKLTGEYAQKARDISQQFVNDPDFINGNVAGMIPKITASRQMMIESGVPPAVAEVQGAHLLQAAAQDPKSVRQMLLNSIQAGMGSAGQAANIRPEGINVTNQQQTQTVATNPFGPVPVGAPIPGTPQQQQLPPTTPVFNPATNAPGYLGPQITPETTANLKGDPNAVLKSIEAIKDPAEREQALAAYSRQLADKSKSIQSGPALGVPGAIAGSVDAVNKDWLDTQDAAKTAQTDIGVLQNVKKYAPGAVTGVESDRRAYLTGLAGLLGMKPADLAKTETDVLAKNTVMLALAGGDTNLAKTMAESANPNTKMTPDAIRMAADQIIAQRKLAIEKQKFLGPLKSMNDPDLYARALAQWNSIADPRILQLADMSPAEKQKMKAAMSENEAREFGEKIRKLQQLGIVK